MKYARLLAVSGTVVAGLILLGGIASAQTMPSKNGHGFGAGGYGQGMMGQGMMHAPGIAGKVSAISGTTLTVTGMANYAVDASKATVMKNGTSSSVSAVNIGDMIFVQGAVSGSNVTATSIRDGMPMGGPGGMHGMKNGGGNASGTWNGSSTMSRRGAPVPQNIIPGNGQPVVGGSVTAISGNTLTVTTANNDVVYTIDAASATIEKGNATSSVASISVGDNVLVQGSVSGTSVTAFSVIDQGAPRTASSSTANSSNGRGLGGFMNSIGGFFHHLFGFF